MSVPMILMHLTEDSSFNDEYGNVNFVDIGINPTTYKFETSKVPFGEPTLIFGSNAPSSADHTFRTEEYIDFYNNDWTLECWGYNGTRFVHCIYVSVGDSYQNCIEHNFYCNASFRMNDKDTSWGFSVAKNTLHHFAITHEASTHKLYMWVDGVCKGPKTYNKEYLKSCQLVIGNNKRQGCSENICEVSLHDEILYTGGVNFVRPTEPYEYGLHAKRPTTMSGTYLAVNGLTYRYRTTFKSIEKSLTSNVVNYVACKKSRYYTGY